MVFLLVPRISTQGDFLLVIGYWFFIGFIGGADPGAVEHVPPERPHVPEAVEEAHQGEMKCMLILIKFIYKKNCILFQQMLHFYTFHCSPLEPVAGE